MLSQKNQQGEGGREKKNKGRASLSDPTSAINTSPETEFLKRKKRDCKIHN